MSTGIILNFGNINPTTLPNLRQTGGGFVWRGVFSGSTAYQPYDVVSYNGATYVALVANVGITPVDGAGTWQVLIGLYDYPLSVSYIGKFAGAQEVVGMSAIRKFTLPQNFVGSIASLEVAATALTTFTLTQNGSNIGTFAFAAAGTVATFSSAGAVTINPGDILRVVAPVTPDTTAQNLFLTLLGTRIF